VEDKLAEFHDEFSTDREELMDQLCKLADQLESIKEQVV